MATIAELDVVLGLKNQQSFTRNLTVATAAVTAAAVAFDRVLDRGGKVAPVMRAFGRQVGNQTQALQRLRGATMGLVSDYDLMVQANTSLKLGSSQSVEEFAQLAAAAQKLGRALGVDAAFALNSLNVGIARQSRLVLDNLGIIVDAEAANRRYADALGLTVSQLSEAQRAEAFRAEAMRQATEAADNLGDAVFTNADAFAALKIELGNVGEALATGAAGGKGLVGLFEGLATAMRTARENAAWIGQGLQMIPGVGGLFRNLGRAPGQHGGSPSGTVDRFLSEQQAQREAAAAERARRFGALPGITGPRSGFDTLTGRRTGYFGADLLDRMPGGFTPPGVSALGGDANKHAGLLGAAALRKTIQKTLEWRDAIQGVADTVENVLVRSLTRAIMKFEGIGSLLKDIGKSFLSAVVGGAVSLGIGALTGNVFGALGLELPGRAKGGPVNAGMAYMVGEQGPEMFLPSQSGTIVPNGGITINVPPARDPITFARDAQWQRAVLETFNALQSNGMRLAK